mgnify:CR=1 FL=1
MAHILLGVTGSIAAFKACHLASDWSKQGHEVRVVMTAAAQEFITPLTFSSLTHTPTRTSMFAAGHRPGATADVAPGPDGPLQISTCRREVGESAGSRSGERRYYRENRLRHRR